MIITLSHIIIITIMQILIANIWYSKYLFKNFLPVNVQVNNILFLFSLVVKSIALYAIVVNVFFILPKSFFYIAVLVSLLIAITSLHNYAVKNQTFNTTLVSVVYNVFSVIVGFYACLWLLV